MKLNYPEAIALITYEIMEGARDGKTVAQLMSEGTTILIHRGRDGRNTGNDSGYTGRSNIPGWD